MAERVSSSGSIKDPRLSNPTNTAAGHSTSKVLEELTTCKCGTLTLDGSNYSDTLTISSSMLRTTRFLKFKVAKMKKVAMLVSMLEVTVHTKDGESFMQTRSKTSRRRE